MESLLKIAKWTKAWIFEKLSVWGVIRKFSSIRMVNQSSGSEVHIYCMIVMSCQFLNALLSYDNWQQKYENSDCGIIGCVVYIWFCYKKERA